jgi:hypothetical protein
MGGPEIERLRRENGSARTNAKAQAAEDAKKELAQTIGKALGLVEDEPIDPAKLTESLTTAQAEAKQAQVALAVYQNAGTVGDPVALLDSTTFLKSVAGIDPTDTAAVRRPSRQGGRCQPAARCRTTDPRTPAPNPAQGSSAAAHPTWTPRSRQHRRPATPSSRSTSRTRSSRLKRGLTTGGVPVRRNHPERKHP